MHETNGIEINKSGSVIIVVFKSACISNVDEITAIKEQLNEYIEKEKPEKMVFDFSCVKFFSSQVLGLLLDIRAKVQENTGNIFISAINPQLHRVFKITNLDKIFTFFPDTETALETIKSD